MYRSKAILNQLILLLTLRILSYCTLFPESVALTQGSKVGLRLLLTLSAILILKSLRQKHRNHDFTYTDLTPLLLYSSYLLLGLLSVAWAALPHYALLQLAMIAEALVFAWFFVQLIAYYNALSDDHARLSLLFGRAAMLICTGFIVGSFIDPELFYRKTHEGAVSRLGGFIINPNELGMLTVLGAVMSYTELLDRRPRLVNIAVAVICGATLMLTQSRSSLLAFLVVSTIFIVRTGSLRIMAPAAVAVVVAVPFLLQSVVLKQGNLDEVMNMTGRLPFWHDLLTDGFSQRPLLGYGFMCVADGEYFHSIHAYSGKMTHNTFVQVLLNLGLVGIFLCLLQMVATLAAILRCSDARYRWLATLMLIPLLVNSFTEFGIFGESNFGIQFYQMLVLFFVVKTAPATMRFPRRFVQKNLLPA